MSRAALAEPRIDVAASGGQVFHDDPFVGAIDGFLDAEECTAIIEHAAGGMTRAVVSGDKAGVTSAGRTNSVHWVRHDATPRHLGIAERVAAVVGLSRAHAESFQVIHYGPSQEYRAHFDAFDASSERGQRNMAKGGQRLITTLCYLNEVEAGGHTEFPRLGIDIAPRRGRLVIFSNCLAGSAERTPLSLHAGKPVETGEKWAFNLWFREEARG